MSLRPCTGCGRHVRNTENSCPFCATALEAAPERAPIVLPRAGRAAIMAFGAIASTTAACGGATPAYGGPSLDAGPTPDAFVAEDDAFRMGGLDAAYGGAPADTGLETDTAMPEADAGGGMTLYGGPPGDAGQTDDAGGSVPLYGGAGL